MVYVSRSVQAEAPSPMDGATCGGQSVGRSGGTRRGRLEQPHHDAHFCEELGDKHGASTEKKGSAE